jgi:putative methyltransferase (TIGR04325 family)
VKLQLKHALRRVLPPIVVDVARRIRDRGAPSAVAGPLHSAPVPDSLAPSSLLRGSVSREPPEWEAVDDGDTVWTGHKGWSHQSIARTQREKWSVFLESVEGTRPFGWSHEARPDTAIDINAHNTILTFGYVLGRAACGNTRVSVLDWGGGIGHYYVYARRLYPELGLDYVVKDLPPLCAVGREILPEVAFVTEDGRALSRRYDLVFASSSLQYTRDLYGLLGQLCGAAAKWLMVTRSPFVREHDDFVVVQRPHRYGYMTEYPGWFINRHRFIAFVETHGFTLEKEFLLDERPTVLNAPEQCRYCGFLFRRVSSKSSAV